MLYKPSAGRFLPIILIFLIVTVVTVVFPSFLENRGIDPDVLLIGNMVLVSATALSFVFYLRSLNNNHAPFFIRMIYSAMFTKMMICLVTAFIYIVTYQKNVSKGAIFACMFLYFVYTFIELAVILKLSKDKKNA
jgi:hypothetical protein